jgi:hypothetical protein
VSEEPASIADTAPVDVTDSSAVAEEQVDRPLLGGVSAEAEPTEGEPAEDEPAEDAEPEPPTAAVDAESDSSPAAGATASVAEESAGLPAEDGAATDTTDTTDTTDSAESSNSSVTPRGDEPPAGIEPLVVGETVLPDDDQASRG